MTGFLRHPSAPLFLTIALATVTVGAANTVLPLYVIAAGGSALDWGFLFAAFSVTLGIGEIVIGVLSDRLGIRRPMMVTRIASALCVGALWILPGVGMIYLIQLLRGLSDSAIWPLGKSHIGRTVPSRSKGVFLGLFYTMTGLGSSLGALLGGFLLEHFGFQAAFACAAAASLISAAIGWIGIVEAPQHTGEGSEQAYRPAERFHLGRLVAVGSVTIILVSGWMSTNTFLPIIASQDAGLGPSEVGLLMSAFGLTTTLLAVPLGRLSDRFGRRRVIIIGLLAMMLSVAGFAFAATFFTLLVSVMAMSVAWSLTSPARVALLSDVMPTRRQGLTMGLIGGFEDMGMVIGSGLSGLLMASFGRVPAYGVVGLTLLGGIAICFWVVREGEWRRSQGI